MSSLKKIIVTLTCSQALCLAFGLWIQHTVGHATLVLSSENLLEGTTENQHALANFFLYAGIVIWLTGIQFCVNWMVISKVYSAVDNRIQKHREDSLVAVNELVRTRDAIIFGLAKLAESRDPETGQHLERISMYSVRLATAMRKHPKFSEIVNSEFVRMIGISSVLHDIGKVGVEDAILLKPDTLSEKEREKIRLHAELGSDCIHQIECRLGNSDFLSMARDIALYHHERWDGQGYPYGLAEKEIPLAARIVAVADVYDALASQRVYKDAVPHVDCVVEIEANAHKQFDADIVDVFLSIHEQFADIAERFQDASPLKGDHIPSDRGGSYIPTVIQYNKIHEAQSDQ
ncbi:HD-GYP domain-containing protein [Thalassoglobus polymorphus]|uniref:Cyclic di-GMP phosphodiesterase response regulator RpfG n=1 Tax=Thalassoglobus polymorphus TaxID=2527994 RepID=A0A517QQ32_9PLAN|nr:HD domain-containing phosphohydrolase [Thalassoglobus polymorphus]QDT33717.1 Cyclic di-GMP phosphodiesterase response regulator RpfG [Thalassoglobus polymorphus]